MDFSIFNRKKDLNEFCEVIVVDFVNKIEVCRKKINNLLPVNPADEQELKTAELKVTEIRLQFIKNQEKLALEKPQENQELGA